MLFAIHAKDSENSSEKRAQAREGHIARLEQLNAEGRLLLAGPYPVDNGYAGSLIVAEFASLDEAKAWAEADPYKVAGAYESVEVYPFKKVYPK